MNDPQYGPQGWVPPGGYVVPPRVPEQVAVPLVNPNFGDWWRCGVAIARRGFKQLAGLQAVGLIVSLVLLVPIAVYTALMSEDLTESLASPDPAGLPDLTPMFGLLGLGLVTVLLSVIVSAVVVVATVHVGVSVAVGTEVRIADALRLAARRVFPVLGWQIVTIPIFLVGLCLCILPVFYVAALFLVLPVVVAVERTNAISRCFALFHSDLGTSVSRAATILGLSIAASVGGGVIGGALDGVAQAASPGRAGLVAGAVISTLVGAVIGAAVAILLAPLTLAAYADMRAHVEMIDTTVIAQDLAIVPSPPAPPAPPAAPGWASSGWSG